MHCAASCTGCGQKMARYYCSICNLWDDQPGRDIYHCPFCNLCRVGKGLGIDACHCMDCNTCMHLSEYATHKCRDLATCPVCTDTLFDSSEPYRVRWLPACLLSPDLHILSWKLAGDAMPSTIVRASV